jgi:hypothetical protein
MCTQAQTQANRRNALNSTGPRTPEGKSRSSANAIRHGLSARFRVFTSENQDDFDDLLADLTRTFAPANAYEHILVMEIAQSHWRLARARRLEADMIDDMAESRASSDHEGVLRTMLLNDQAGALLVLQRHAAAAERTGYRAVKQLIALRKLEAQTARDAARQNEPNSAPGASDTMEYAPPKSPATENDPHRHPINDAPNAPTDPAITNAPEFQPASDPKTENPPGPNPTHPAN